MSIPAPATPSKAEFAFELLKLLLQVAWADDDVAPDEAGALLAYAQKKPALAGRNRPPGGLFGWH